jgi:hypothetical protein
MEDYPMTQSLLELRAFDISGELVFAIGFYGDHDECIALSIDALVTKYGMPDDMVPESMFSWTLVEGDPDGDVPF